MYTYVAIYTSSKLLLTPFYFTTYILHITYSTQPVSTLTKIISYTAALYKALLFSGIC